MTRGIRTSKKPARCVGPPETLQSEPGLKRLTATLEGDTVRFENGSWQRADFDLKVAEVITRKPSSFSSVVVEELTGEEFPQIQSVQVVKNGVVNATKTPGKRMLLPVGLFDIQFVPAEGGKGDTARTLVRGIRIGRHETVTVHTNRLITGVTVKPIEGVTPKSLLVTSAGGRRDKFSVITHGGHVARCDGFDKVMVVPAGYTFDVLMDVDKQTTLMPIAEKVTPHPGELFVIDRSSFDSASGQEE